MKWTLYFLLIPIVYISVSLILTAITIDRKTDHQVADKIIYLSTNGVHLDIVIHKNDIDSLLLSGIQRGPSDNYLSFGWGDENFYINTPTWADLTFSNACKAIFLKSPTAMHVTRYKSIRADWVEIKISETELDKLNNYVSNTFRTNGAGTKIILEHPGYSSKDDFYKAKGNYSFFKTCNSWVNLGFRESGLKCCLWTPFDFGLMNKYEHRFVNNTHSPFWLRLLAKPKKNWLYALGLLVVISLQTIIYHLPLNLSFMAQEIALSDVYEELYLGLVFLWVGIGFAITATAFAIRAYGHSLKNR